jgi:hypothetical protein
MAEALQINATELLDRITSTPQLPRFHAKGRWESRESLVEYDLSVDHISRVWRVHDLTHDIVAEYRDGFITHGVERTPAESYRHPVTMVPLQMVFPEMLPLWGRGRGDSDFPVRVEPFERAGDLITFQSTNDPALRKTAVFDRELGMVTRFYDALTVTSIDKVVAL